MKKPPRTFHIFATRECIDNAKRNSTNWCIFALAIIYSIPGSVRPSVDENEVRFSYRGFRYIFATPQKSAKIAKGYDNGSLRKSEIEPWGDVLTEPISVERSAHRRPKEKKQRRARAADARKEGQRAESTKIARCNRWAGRKIP